MTTCRTTCRPVWWCSGPTIPTGLVRGAPPRKRPPAAYWNPARVAPRRRYRNALVFLAPDHARLQALDEAIRLHLAWKSILTDPLDLTRRQMRRVERDRDDAAQIITARLLLAYTWLLTPVQKTLAGSGSLEGDAPER